MKDIYTVTDDSIWFRSFRYIQQQIAASDQALTLQSFTPRETVYPLPISADVQAGPELDKIWNISLRAL